MAGRAGPWSNESLHMEPSQGGAGDRELMARLAAGDREALAPLMEKHYRRLYRIALAYLRQPDDALDVVQEAFVKAFQSAPKWDGSAEAGPWLARITVNLSIDRWRRNRRRAQTFTPLTESDHAASLADARAFAATAACKAARPASGWPPHCGGCPSASAPWSCCATTRT